MICRRIFVFLELLPLALLDLKIGSNDGVQLVSSFGCFLFFSPHETFATLHESLLVIELEL